MKKPHAMKDRRWFYAGLVIFLFLPLIYVAVRIKTPGKVVPDFARDYLILPFFLITYSILFKYMSDNPKWRAGYRDNFQRIIVHLVAPALVTVFLIGSFLSFVISVNTLWGTQEAVAINGTIRKIDMVSGRSGRTCWVELGQDNGEILQLSYAENKCGQLKSGDKLSVEMTRGGFGILYTTRW